MIGTKWTVAMLFLLATMVVGAVLMYALGPRVEGPPALVLMGLMVATGVSFIIAVRGSGGRGWGDEGSADDIDDE